jgi:K+-transporting ATPase ATPase A chain
MGSTTSGLLTIAVLVSALALAHRPLGDYMARVYTSTRHLRVERWIYRVVGVDPESDQRWRTYCLSVLAFSAVGVAALMLLLMLQGALLPGPFGGVHWHGAFNTAVSFVTNTNWQWYSGESTLNNLTQTLGLTVQNFVSAATGMAVAIAFVRGFVRTRTDRLGNFWVDLVRTVVRILLPISVVAAVVLVSQGVIQNLLDSTTVQTLAGGTQEVPGGLIASQEAIKDLGTNGGGPFNANSSHPFESPNPFTNLLEIFLLLVIPFSLPRTVGVLLGDRRQGYAILGAMAFLYATALAVTTWAEVSAGGTAPQLAGAAMEGKEQQFGVWSSALFATSTTGTSTGSVNSMHDSFTAAGGGTVLVNMLLGEVSPGGVGAGIYGILIMAVIAVFLAGLMVGRTPEYLSKKIGRHEITYAALSTLVMPTLVLVGVAASIGLSGPRESLLNDGPHGLSEVLYAFASAANNNGSAFAGLSAGTEWYNVTLGLAMLLGRFVPIVLVLALAGRLASQRAVPVTAGTLPTHTPLFVGLLVGVILLVAGLTFVPGLALAPVAEALQ